MIKGSQGGCTVQKRGKSFTGHGDQKNRSSLRLNRKHAAIPASGSYSTHNNFHHLLIEYVLLFEPCQIRQRERTPTVTHAVPFTTESRIAQLLLTLAHAANISNADLSPWLKVTTYSFQEFEKMVCTGSTFVKICMNNPLTISNLTKQKCYLA